MTAKPSSDTTTPSDSVAPVLERLAEANAAFQERYPGEGGERQPVHTVYGGAHLFRAGSAERLGGIARDFLEEYAPDFAAFARAVGLGRPEILPDSGSEAEALAARLERSPEAAREANPEAWFAHTVYRRMRRKLEEEPVEDFRIDFEDGYGVRPDREEDETAREAAGEVARGMEDGSLPPFLGIRIKPLSAELAGRAARTLRLFVSALASETGGRLPENFVVTLPKVEHRAQVTALVELFEALEADLPLEPGALRMEIMVETPQAILDHRGRCPLPELVRAADGRCAAAHFGVYDYTASCAVTAEHQTMDHPVCDMARRIMQVSLAGTGVWLSDGATNVLPVPVHRSEEDGPPLSSQQQLENRRSVHRAWRMHFRDVQRSLRHAYYQGWDLHPAQLATRYAAVYAFFLDGLDSATERLRSFVDRAAQATLVGDVMDDAATGQGLLNFFLRGVNCGAITREEALETGLTLEEIRRRSFGAILEARSD